MVAMDKKTGKDVWRYTMKTYAWPSPVDVYDASGNGYILQSDHDGTVHLVDGKTGKALHTLKIDYYLEASPSVFGNYAVVPARSGWIYGLKLK